MSIVADVKQAKWEYEQHIAQHKCRDSYSMRSDGLVPCADRTELIQAWFGTAGLLGLEPDDDARQRAHHLRNLRPAAA